MNIKTVHIMIEALQFEFMRHALMAGLLAGLACGIIGALVVVNRIVFISGGIAHASYGGIGIAFFFRIPYLAGTLGFSFVIAMIMAAVTLNNRQRSDTVIGVLWAFGMAIGILLMDLTPGYNVDLMSYLFGSILAVPISDLWVMAGITLFTVLIVGYFYNDFLAMSYDAEFARVRGVAVTFLYFLLMALTAFTVVMVIRVVGLILVIAMLTIPPFIAEKYSQSLFQMMIWSSLLNFLFIIIGLWAAYTFNLTAGATIILVGSSAFLLSLVVDKIRD